MQQSTILVVLSICVLQTLSTPNSDRVVEEKPLSSTQHYDADGKHNPDYDHDAFLGGGDRKSWDNLTPDESKQKLDGIIDKIDEDRDGSLTTKELKKWIEQQQNKYVHKDVERYWKVQDMNLDGFLTWQEYNETTYSGLPLTELVKMPGNDYVKRVSRDKTRWVGADQDKDDKLDFNEYIGFIHPEEKEHMYDIYTTEQLEEMDKDNDQKISVEEYIDDIMKSGHVEGGDDPDWVTAERESFVMHRDRNADGYLDHSELKEWLLPSSYDIAEAEAKHLIYEVDKNDDRILSRQEILDEWKTFVPSRVLLAERDEL